MRLYHNNMSVCAQKVRLVLREKGLRPEEHHLNLRAGDQFKPEFLRLNPKAVIPVLVDEVNGKEEVITESTIICEYLEEAYPQSPLRPASALERARMRSWTQLPDAGLHHNCGVISLAIAFRCQFLARGAEAVQRMLTAKPDPVARELMRHTIELGVAAPAVAQHIRAYDQMLTGMSRQLADTPWLAGEACSLADAAMRPYVCRLEHLQQEWLWTESRQGVGDWLRRCKQRSNFSGISDYLDGYLELMKDCGSKARDQVAALLAA